MRETNDATAEMFFFFNDTATTEIYTLSLHGALPIFLGDRALALHLGGMGYRGIAEEVGVSKNTVGPLIRAALKRRGRDRDRKSTRLNSSHANISYAVFCLKKKKTYASSTYLYRTTAV